MHAARGSGVCRPMLSPASELVAGVLCSQPDGGACVRTCPHLSGNLLCVSCDAPGPNLHDWFVSSCSVLHSALSYLSCVPAQRVVCRGSTEQRGLNCTVSWVDQAAPAENRSRRGAPARLLLSRHLTELCGCVSNKPCGCHCMCVAQSEVRAGRMGFVQWFILLWRL